MQAEAREQKKAAIVLHSELARYRAEELAAAAEPITLTGEPHETVRLVARAIDADASGLKALATAIVTKPGHLVVLVSSSTPALAVVARSADVSLPAQRLLASLHAVFGGRGGGKSDFAQGGGLTGSPESVLAAARAAL
jgi:alanyl-tRNA synthetase